MWSTHRNVLALKFIIFFPNLKLSFIVIVIVILCINHSNRCSFTKNMIRRSPMVTICRPWIMVVGVLRPLPSSNELMVDNPRSMNCDIWVWMGSSAKFILQRLQRSPLEPLNIFSPITLLKMDVKSKSSGNFLSTTASNFWGCPSKPGESDCCLFPTFCITSSPQGREVPKIPIRTGEDILMTLTELLMLPGVLPPTPVLLTFRIFMLIHATTDAAFATTSFISGVNSICNTNTIHTILWSVPGFIGGGKTGMVR